jgi:prolyl-tRNA editing enzyme YbaK/EbsC (Cys-tRNA(Pro) deacylase)
MKPASSEGAMRIQAILGDAFRVLEFEQSTRSSAEAAAAIGCEVAQIAKSMLFRTADGRPVLVVTSGSNRVDEKKVAALLGRKIKRAEPDFVLTHTGAAVGGVPPVGHTSTPKTFSGSRFGGSPDNLGSRGVTERGICLDPGGSGEDNGR